MKTKTKKKGCVVRMDAVINRVLCKSRRLSLGNKHHSASFSAVGLRLPLASLRPETPALIRSGIPLVSSWAACREAGER